jgi:two-component system, OmpR family, sensor histidine kinase QseC
MITAKAPASLLRRMLLTVLCAFVAIFLMLLCVIAYDTLRRESGQIDKSLLASSQSLATGLDKTKGGESAAAIGVMMEAMASGNVSPDEFVPLLAAARLDGGDKFADSNLPPIDVMALPLGVSSQKHGDKTLRLYTAKGQLWKVALVDNEKVRRSQMLIQIGAELALYLSLALPIVLLPVWWAVKRAVAPLQALSDAVAARSPTDTTPLHMPRAYRELKPLENALNNMFERVAHGLAREKAFVNDAAHELRTPLAVISAQAHVLVHSDGAERAPAQQKLNTAVDRASHLTHQLLRLARADAAAQNPRQPADVMNLARDTLAQFAQRAEGQGTELSLQGPDSLTQDTDVHALRSIFENLIDNALRYGGEGGEVQVLVQPMANGVEVRVSDCGPGIAPEHRAQVFERFWRGKHEHQRGSGLGLAIVAEAVRSLGGQVHVQAQAAGSGCTMVVSLPSPVASQAVTQS